MSVSGVSFGGLASGLDTGAIISALLAVEQRPIDALQDKKSLLRSQKNLFGDIEGLLKDLVDKAKDIRRASTFVNYKASVDKEQFLSASASSSAVSGSYDIEVERLAKAQVQASDGFASADSLVGAGTVLFTVDGETKSVEATSSDSLASFAAKINDADAGVRAQVVDTGEPGDSFKLILTAEEPGTENGFSYTLDVASPEFTTFIDQTMSVANQITAAQDAVINIDGLQITRSSNQLSDVIQGVTIDLIGASAGEITRLTVTTDTEATSEKVKGFVDEYNKIVDFLEGQSQVDEEGNTNAPLFGDVTLRSIRSKLREIAGSVVGDTGNQAYQMFAQIGIDSDTDGRLTFTQSEFEAALVDDENAIRNLFTQDSTGIANRIFNELDQFTDSIDGLIKARKDGLDRMTKSIDDNIARAERRLEQMELGLTNRFANLEVLLNRLQGQGSAVAGIG